MAEAHNVFELVARCFNEGCDARWRGEAIEQCPYEAGVGPEAAYWKLGWRDMHWHWGSRVRGRWRHQPLTPLGYFR